MLQQACDGGIRKKRRHYSDKARRGFFPQFGVRHHCLAVGVAFAEHLPLQVVLEGSLQQAHLRRSQRTEAGLGARLVDLHQREKYLAGKVVVDLGSI